MQALLESRLASSAGIGGLVVSVKEPQRLGELRLVLGGSDATEGGSARSGYPGSQAG